MSTDSSAFSPTTLAEHWGVKRFHVLNLIKTGKLTAFNVALGKRPVYRIPSDEVARFEAERLTKPAKASPRRATSAGKYY